MNHDLLRMWKIIIQNQEMKNGSDPEDTRIFMDHVEIFPIDAYHCVTELDGVSYLLVQKNGLVMSAIEGGAL